MPNFIDVMNKLIFIEKRLEIIDLKLECINLRIKNNEDKHNEQNKNMDME